MRELDLDYGALSNLIRSIDNQEVAVFEIPAESASVIADQLSVAVRRCYVSDAVLDARAHAAGRPRADILAARLPDRGSTMAGDFGEILTSIFQAAREHPNELFDAKKWRLKQDRTMPAPKSDVVQMVLPYWPLSSAEDRLICSEVKTKSTHGGSTPVADAIRDSRKDSDGRLIKTLEWLKERALDTGLTTVTIEMLDRFIEAIDHPQASLEFSAVAVLCASLDLESELRDVALPSRTERAVVILTVPDLKTYYEDVFQRALVSVSIG